TTEPQVAAGGPIVSQWRCRGTHKGELMGVAATGKTIEVEGISILHLENGRIRHQTTVWDPLGLLRKIGGVPTVKPPAGGGGGPGEGVPQEAATASASPSSIARRRLWQPERLHHQGT